MLHKNACMTLYASNSLRFSSFKSRIYKYNIYIYTIYTYAWKVHLQLKSPRFPICKAALQSCNKLAVATEIRSPNQNLRIADAVWLKACRLCLIEFAWNFSDSCYISIAAANCFQKLYVLGVNSQCCLPADHRLLQSCWYSISLVFLQRITSWFSRSFGSASRL